MDPQQKQKVMIGVLAVLAIGAGSYYFLAGDSGPQQVQTATGDDAPRERVVETVEVKQRQTSRGADARDAEEEKVERAERVIDDSDRGTTRTRRTSGGAEKKKVQKAPAA